jgi:8-oxo-dGTP pyrophosphatase MutT (NUDIX family)
MASMHELARSIRLRRPPLLARVPGPFVPKVDLAKVDRAWERLRQANPRYFDGPVLHVLGVSRNGHGGTTIHVVETSYRFYAVQRPGLVGGLDCGVRPLGAKGICRVVEDDRSVSRPSRYVMARRSQSVAFYPGAWEFAPGGGLEPNDDPASCVLRELAEETDFEAVRPPIAVAILEDPIARSWEVVHAIDVRPSQSADATHAWEHAERTLVEHGRWPEPLCAIARRMTRLCVTERRAD